MKKIFCVILLLSFSHSSFANSYWGLGAGPSSFDIKPAFGSDEVEDTTAIRFLFGSRNNNTGIELDVSLADYNWVFNSSGSHTVLNIIFSGVGYLPISDSFSLFGKIGANFWSTTVDFAGSIYEGDDSIGIAASAGMDYSINESLHITAEYQILPGLSDGVDDGDISQAMINVLYYF